QDLLSYTTRRGATLLDQTWIQGVAALLELVLVFPVVSLGKHPLPVPLPISIAVLSRQGLGQHHRSPTRRQILLMEAANILWVPFQSLALASGNQRVAILAAFAIPYCQLPPLKIQIPPSKSLQKNQPANQFSTGMS
ncbi:MAG: hypothetical protein WAM11_04420, partial [Cyanobium sp.]